MRPILDPATRTRGGLAAWFGGRLAPPEGTAFRNETAEVNARRLRALLPLMLVLHAVHVALFRTPDAIRSTLAPNVVRWRHDLVLAHAVTLACALPLGLALYALRGPRAARLLAPVAAVLYLVHGAVVTGVDQLSMANATVFVGYAFGTAVVLSLPPVTTIVVYGVGLASFVTAIEVMQPSAVGRLTVMPNGFSSVAVSVALSFLLFGARRRDFAQRTTIDRQRAELEAMNSSLEGRVREQVSEIVERAREIELLNAQLQAQVRARSTELSMALAKLARDRDADGHLREGVVLGNRFVIQELLGQGGMGAVYAGLDRSTDERVAIKVIQATSASELDGLHRFLREAESAATVAHSAVVKMRHVDVSADGMLFQVQELVVGEPLSDRLRTDGRWAFEHIARLGAVLMDALAASHAKGVVHLDVKPANIMVTRTAPGLKLLDFGIARLLSAREERGATGKVMGTPGYMAPEMLCASAALTDRVDVFASGVLFFQMLSGALPFEEATLRDVLCASDRQSAPDVSKLVSGVPVEMAEIVARCLAIDPTGRPDAEAVRTGLARIADAGGAPALEEIVRALGRTGTSLPASEAATVGLGPRTSR